MIGYLFKRLLGLIPTVLGITLITFIMLKSIPGDPACSLVGERAEPGVIARNREMMGLDRPLWVQYALFVGNLSCFKLPQLRVYTLGPFRFRFVSLFKRPYLGHSYFTRQAVSEMLLEKFPRTLRLALAAMLAALIIGIGSGLLAAASKDHWPDRLAMLLALGGISTPVFWTGLLLIIVFSNLLGWLPASGMGGGALVFLILPAVTLGSHSGAYLARITRSSLLEVAAENYITTARAKGLPERLVLLKHAFRNALIPVITLAGLDFGSYLNGAVLTETIFGWDGIGSMAMKGIIQRDYPVILGCVLLGAVVFVLVNILVDISYSYIDPRVRYK